jgi:branched-chain amino acid aminotransferase
MAFTLNSYPITYRARFAASGWTEEYLEKPHKTPTEEAAMGEAEREALAASRNFYSDMPLVNYTTQYGLGCFEGLKALPQKDGGLAIFRPDQNAKRFKRSMEGLLMPGFPEDAFVKAVVEVVRRNAALGFRPQYQAEWKKDSFMTADSVYIRPFTYAEGGIGVAPSKALGHGHYHPGKRLLFERPLRGGYHGVSGHSRGTGWIKAASNYVISTLAKHEANQAGFMECVFLDAKEQKYLKRVLPVIFLYA